MADGDTPTRAGSGVDLAHRMDRIEKRQDSVEDSVRTLTATVTRVAQNQNHAEELSKLRFNALDVAVSGLTAQLGAFITRIEGVITGEIQTAQSRSGAELVADYKRWRASVEERFDAQAVMNGQVKLLGRIAWALLTTNILSIAAAVWMGIQA